jgi:Bacterial regulatory proteins, tetR family
VTYSWQVPRLWDATIQGRVAHRAAVPLDTTAALVAEHGLAAVTMSQIAAEAGIGRATQLGDFVRDLLREGAASGQVRDAVAAARHLPSKAAVRRLVGVIRAGLQPTR